MLLWKFVLDVGVLSSLLTTLRGEDMPDLVQLVFIAFLIAVVNVLCVLFLGAALGIFILLPILVLDGLILMFFCSLTLKQALFALGFLVVYNIVFRLCMMFLFM